MDHLEDSEEEAPHTGEPSWTPESSQPISENELDGTDPRKNTRKGKNRTLLARILCAGSSLLSRFEPASGVVGNHRSNVRRRPRDRKQRWWAAGSAPL